MLCLNKLKQLLSINAWKGACDTQNKVRSQSVTSHSYNEGQKPTFKCILSYLHSSDLVPSPLSKCCNHVTSALKIREVRILVRKCPICKNVSTVLSQILATNRFQIFYCTIYKKYNFNSIYRCYVIL